MEFTLKATFNTSAEKLYTAWLDSEQHAAMIGGDATASDQVGNSFTAWGDYISGKNLELEPHQRIVQSWRTTEFTDEEEDSQIEVLLDDKDGVVVEAEDEKTAAVKKYAYTPSI